MAKVGDQRPFGLEEDLPGFTVAVPHALALDRCSERLGQSPEEVQRFRQGPGDLFQAIGQRGPATALGHDDNRWPTLQLDPQTLHNSRIGVQQGQLFNLGLISCHSRSVS